MPKLKAIHLSKIGHPSARFDGVSIYFTPGGNPDGIPEKSTILNLRNGGGKTTLIHLFVSTFLPNKNEFIGKSDGGDRAFDQYLQPNEMGMIVTEWTLEENKGTRVIGQCAIKGNASDTQLEQQFFSFLVLNKDYDFQVSDLPMRQFENLEKSGNISSMNEFKRYLHQEIAEKHPHQQYTSTSIQREWLNALRKWGHEPELYRLLITLNKSEGGSKDMAKNNFGTTEKMIGLIAMLSMSELDRKREKNTGNIHDLISNYREDLNKLPQKELEKRMWEQLTAALVELIGPGEELAKAENDKNVTTSELSAIYQKVMATPIVLQNKITVKDRNLTKVTQAIEDNNNNINVLQKQQRWLEKQVLHLKEDLATVAFEEARKKRDTSDMRYRAMQAYNIIIAISKLENQIQGIQVAIKVATKPTEEIRANLNGIGSRIYAYLETKKKEELKRKEGADNRYQQATGKLNDLREEEGEKNTSKGEVTAQLENLSQWFKKAAVSHAALDIEDQPAVGVLKKKEGQKLEDDSALKALETEEQELDEQKTNLFEAQKDADAKRTAAVKDLELKEVELNKYRTDYNKIAFDETLKEFTESEENDPYLEGLIELLTSKQANLESDKLNLEIKQRRCYEAKRCYQEDDYELMPPSEDVMFVYNALVEQDIMAVPYVKFLSEDNTPADQIRELLRKDPARYSGVGVLGTDVLDAMNIVSELDSLRGPVQIYPLDKHEDETLSDSLAISGVALPFSNATFNKFDAKAEFKKLSHEIASRSDKIKQIENRVAKIKKAVGNLTLFLQTYPVGIEKSLTQERRHLEKSVKILAERLKIAKKEYEDHKSVVVSNKQQQKKTRERLKEIEAICIKLKSYIENYESLYPSKQREQDSKKKRLISLKKRLNAIRLGIENQESQVGLARKEANEAKSAAKTTEIQKGKLIYKNSSVGQMPSELNKENLDSLQATYHKLLGTFEEKNEGIKIYQVEIKGLQERINEKQEKQDKHQIEAIPKLVFDEIFSKYKGNEIDESILDVTLKSLEEAKEVTILAGADLKKAKSEITDNPFDSSDVLEPENIDQFSTVNACEIEGRAIAQKLLETESILEAAFKEKEDLENSIKALEQEKEYLDKLVKTVRRKIAYSGVQDTEIEGYKSYAEANDQWLEARDTDDEADEALTRKRNIVESYIANIEQLIESAEYGEIAQKPRQDIRKQRNTLHLEAGEFAKRAQNYLEALEHTLSKTKIQQKEIVEYLLTTLSSVNTNLKALDRLSIIPETDTKWANWSGHKFFRVKSKSEHLEDGYCEAKIEEFVQNIVQSNDRLFPNNAQEIIEGVARFSLKGISKITTMKPDYFMSTNREQLEVAASWSGGEGFTYAALSLMIFNRLISYINSTTTLSGGILIVDNPIGVCNHLDFIKLQQIMADILNVQLVYPTAVKDLDALGLFPNIVTLSNNQTDAKTGHKHVTVESHTINRSQIKIAHTTFTLES